VRREPAYDEPYFWWGPGWRPPAARTLADLVEEGTLSLAAAGLLAAAVGRRWSLAVVAGPSGAGKTTLLTTLLPWIPDGTRRFYVRGSFEPFAFLDDAAVVPRRSTLLCNEISPHLPSYLWGEGVARLLDARTRGFQILATAHADDAVGFVRLLAGPPLRIAADRVAGFDLVVAVAPQRADEAAGRVVSGIWTLRRTRAGAVEVGRLGDGRTGLPELASALAAVAPPGDIEPVDAAAVAAAMGGITARGPDRAAPGRGIDTPTPEESDRQPWRPRRYRPNG